MATIEKHWPYVALYMTCYVYLSFVVFVKQGVMHGFKAGHTHMHVEAIHASSGTARMQLYYA